MKSNSIPQLKMFQCAFTYLERISDRYRIRCACCQREITTKYGKLSRIHAHCEEMGKLPWSIPKFSGLPFPAFKGGKLPNYLALTAGDKSLGVMCEADAPLGDSCTWTHGKQFQVTISTIGKIEATWEDGLTYVGELPPDTPGDAELLATCRREGSDFFLELWGE